MSENASFPETELMDKTAAKSYIDEKLKQDYPHGGPDPYYKLFMNRVMYSLTHAMAL
jgi:hypothetical protein